jgi:hypothetical protein
MIASGQNVKRLLTFGMRGPKEPAQVAALRHPAPGHHTSCEVREHHQRCSWRPAMAFFNTLPPTRQLGEKVAAVA